MRKIKNEELGRKSIEEYKNAVKVPVCIVLDNVRSLNNVGSAFRTADAFTFEKIICCGITGTPPHRDIQKTALGATESVEWAYEKEVVACVQQLKDQGYYIIAIEQATHRTFLQDLKIDPSLKYAVIFGNEVSGVDDKVINIADEVVEIPQYGTKHSLNISVSIGVVLWDFVSKQKKLPD